jgi:hypothetical protein
MRETNTHFPSAETLNDTIYEDGIAFVKGGLPVEWADQLNKDVTWEFMNALTVPGGTVSRGFNRFYFEPYAELTPGFIDLASHVAVAGVSKYMLGDNYKIVEWGSDLPLPGAEDQWPHRDFPMPTITATQRKLVSLAVNASCIDVEENNAPFRFAKGTQFDDGSNFVGNEGDPDSIGGMFPVDEERDMYESRMETILGKRGNFSIRSGLAIHGGSASETNNSRLRPTVILGIVAPEDRAWVASAEDLRVRNDNHVPRIRVSNQYLNFLDDNKPELLQHLSYEVVAETTADLPPYYSHHDFEGLIMGNDPQLERNKK